MNEDNKDVQEVIYSNDAYRVELIELQVSEDNTAYLYGVYNNDYNVLEVETPLLAKALNSADELETAVNTFFQSKSFDNVSSSPVIATA